MIVVTPKNTARSIVEEDNDHYFICKRLELPRTTEPFVRDPDTLNKSIVALKI